MIFVHNDPAVRALRARQREASRRYRERHPDRVKAIRDAHKKRFVEKHGITPQALWRAVNAEFRRLYERLHKHGLTLDQYHAKLEAQDFGCAICGVQEPVLAIDHCHRTGRFRGLLCNTCNLGIAYLQEQFFAQAAAYISKWSAA